MKTTAFLLMMFVPAVASAQTPRQSQPTTGYAPVNGLKMYYEVHGDGEPLVLPHGAFMTITNNWIGELSKTRKVIAVELQSPVCAAISTRRPSNVTSPTKTSPTT